MKIIKRYDELRDYQVMPVCAYGNQYFRLPKTKTKNKGKIFRLLNVKRKYSNIHGQT